MYGNNKTLLVAKGDQTYNGQISRLRSRLAYKRINMGVQRNSKGWGETEGDEILNKLIFWPMHINISEF